MDRLSLYDILGADRTASEVELKSAWRARMLEVHPDHGGSSVGTLAVQKAYEVLRDPDRRRTYDFDLDAASNAATRAEGERVSTKRTTPNEDDPIKDESEWASAHGSTNFDNSATTASNANFCIATTRRGHQAGCSPCS
jgi:DnaJ-class molecular chaperone